MANANIIKLKDIAPNGTYVNNFIEFTAIGAVELAVGVKWFLLDEWIYNQYSAYLYLSGSIDQNVVVELFRSGGYDSFDTDFAVPIPGAILTMAVAVPGTPERVTIDFNISNFGADKLWIKTTGGAGLAANQLDKVNLILKP